MDKDIKGILERNKKVERDKAWETSLARKLIISTLTYFIIVLFLLSINVETAWLVALVPTMGFLLSTLTLPFFKKLWIKNIYRK